MKWLEKPTPELDQYWSVELVPELWPLYHAYIAQLRSSGCYWYLRGLSHERGNMIDVQGFGDDTYTQLTENFVDQAENLMESLHRSK